LSVAHLPKRTVGVLLSGPEFVGREVVALG
jgi:hypothetical protein